MNRRAGGSVLVATAVTAVLTVGLAGPAGANPGARRFVEHDLVSDVKGKAVVTDPGLVNAWGMAQGPATPVWVAANGTNQAELYTGDGVIAPPSKVGLTVNVPGDGVTGQVFNPTPGFEVSDHNGHHGPAVFIFDSESGDITGWNPAVPPPQFSTKAQRGAHVDGAIFKGLALATNGGSSFLYAADFHRGRIVVLDDTFDVVHLAGSFDDPNLPDGYAPFNVAAIGNKLYVAYAVQDADREDEVAGAGKGLIDVFDTAGHFVRRLVSHGALDAPWGMAIAPSGFGGLGGALLVGNFGDGRIHAYDAHSGALIRTLRRPNGHPVVIDGLWALMFGNGTSADTTTLLFSAGPDDESHGLYGSLVAT